MIARLGVGAILAVLGAGAASAQEPAREDRPPSREEFESLQEKVQALADRTSRRGKEGPAVRWNVGAQWRVMANAANFGWHPATIGDHEDTRSFVNQRFRTWLSFAPTEKVGGYLQLEVGHVVWGEDREGTKTFGQDAVGIELRRGFLTYTSEQVGRFRVGIQDWHDAFGESPTLGSFDAVDDYDSFGAVLANSIWDFNVGGVAWSRTFPDVGNLAINAGVFVLWEGDDARADDVYLFAMDADLPVWEEDEGIGTSLYYLVDRGEYSYPTSAPYDSSWDLWFGVRVTRKVASVPLRAWVILNTGQRDDPTGPGFDHTGWAAKIEACEMAVGPGRLSVQGIYSSGEGNPDDRSSGEFRTIAQSDRDDFGSQGYWSYLALSAPHGPSDVKDLGVGLQNRGLGLVTLQAKYSYPVSGPFSGQVAAGALWSAADNPRSGKSYMGTEIANTFTWDLGGGLTWAFGGAYFFTGGFYENPATGDPVHLWELFSRFQLEL